MNCLGATSYRQKPAGNPSPPFRGRGRGPRRKRGRVRWVGRRSGHRPPSTWNGPQGRPSGGLPSLPGRRLGHAHMFGWYRSDREPVPLSARLRREREGPGVVRRGGEVGSSAVRDGGSPPSGRRGEREEPQATVTHCAPLPHFLARVSGGNARNWASFALRRTFSLKTSTGLRRR